MHFSLNVACHFFIDGSISFLCFLLFLCFDLILGSFFCKKHTITCLTSTFRSMPSWSFLAQLQSQEKLTTYPLDLAAKDILLNTFLWDTTFGERMQHPQGWFSAFWAILKFDLKSHETILRYFLDLPRVHRHWLLLLWRQNTGGASYQLLCLPLHFQLLHWQLYWLDFWPHLSRITDKLFVTSRYWWFWKFTIFFRKNTVHNLQAFKWFLTVFTFKKGFNSF